MSILSIISKVFEKIVHNQLNVYLKENNLLYNFQSGFRANFSTDTCLIHLLDEIRLNADQGNYTGMVVLDLQKAFDTVNHSILLDKMSAMGVNFSSICWFKSYLSDRSQIVDVNGTHSESKEISCGVPQGSILGPLLFLLYVNDMPASVNCKLLLYADDSALIVPGKDVLSIEQTLTSELKEVCEWLIENKLSIHLGKTESILFGSSRKLSKVKDLDIHVNGNNITAKSEITYLGLSIDQNFTCNNTASKVVSKCAGRLSFLYRNCNYFPFKTKKLLVSALVQPLFDYVCACWYTGVSKYFKSRLQTAQNKVIRFLLNEHPRFHIGAQQFVQVNMLPVHTRVDQLKLNQMFKVKSGTAPVYLCNSFSMNRSTHNTRNSVESYMIPHVNSFGRSSFMFTASKLWNNLPANVKMINSKPMFKKSVKELMFQNTISAESQEFMYY